MVRGPHPGRGRGLDAALLLARSSLRFYQRHPAQLALSVLGIVLGTGIVVAVLITNASASRAFALSTDTLYGHSTHHLGAADGIEQRLYAALRTRYPAVPMAPVIEGHVALGDTVLTLLGIDPFAEAPFARFGGALTDSVEALAVSAGALLDTPDAIVIAEPTRARLSLILGDSAMIDTPSGPASITPVASFSNDNPAAIDGLAVGDIALVQELLERGNRLDRIELILANDEVATFAATLPATVRLEPAAARRQTMQAMTRGFQINLTAMSLLALVVGAFLIHNTMTFAVLQRRELFATLRITGLTSRQLLFTVLAEAATISLAGSLIGIALGRVLADVLIRLTTRTINDLYFVLHVQDISFGPLTVLLGLVLGIGSSLVAASAAAADAAATSPVAARQRSVVEQRTTRLLGPLAIGGLIAMSTGIVLALSSLQSLVAGFGALMLLIVGYGLAVPFAVHRTARLLQGPAARLGVLPALAVGGIERNISRTGLAIAALAIAVSATFGVDVMIRSFRATVDDWLGTTLASDVYVSSPSTVSGADQRLLDQSLAHRAAQVDGVVAVSTGRELDIVTDVGAIETLVLEPHADSAASFEIIDTEPAAAWQEWLASDAVLISEPLATRSGLGAGDTLTLFTGRAGDRAFRIAGVFRDYASSHGKLMLSRASFARHWDDPRIGSLGLMLGPSSDDGSSNDAALARLRDALADPGVPLQIRSGRAIHEASLAVFDRTFEVTRVLRWLTVGVAFVGIFSALLALHLERAREFAVLRATGASRSQILVLVLVQTAVMGALAGLLALPLGWITSEMLIRVINVRSFGWRMDALLPPGSVIATLALAFASATLAGLYPAWRLARAGIARQLTSE